MLQGNDEIHPLNSNLWNPVKDANYNVLYVTAPDKYMGY